MIYSFKIRAISTCFTNFHQIPAGLEDNVISPGSSLGEVQEGHPAGIGGEAAGQGGHQGGHQVVPQGDHQGAPPAGA